MSDSGPAGAHSQRHMAGELFLSSSHSVPVHPGLLLQEPVALNIQMPSLGRWSTCGRSLGVEPSGQGVTWGASGAAIGTWACT